MDPNRRLSGFALERRTEASKRDIKEHSYYTFRLNGDAIHWLTSGVEMTPSDLAC
jgi:hypothetical protein